MKKIEFLSPASHGKVQVQSGETYEFQYDVSTRAGHVHGEGTHLHVHDSTKETPFDEIGPYDLNWYCRTEFGISVWATLESCIERGLLKKVS